MTPTPTTTAAQVEPISAELLEAKLVVVEKALREGLAAGSIKPVTKSMRADIVGEFVF